ncbi:MFS transporter [Kitasatospora sp. NBC_01539]|uniref:MFS transporter n=1 Tax=Kitasatospora sp. NBC_01539 TaxID=2903577 RepID=UPI0038602148
MNPLKRLAPRPGALLPQDGAQRLLAGIAFLVTFGYGIYLTGEALYLTQGLHLPAGQVGLGMGVAGAVALAAGIPVGHLADRHGARGVYTVMLLLCGLAMTGLCFTRTFWPFLFYATVFSFAQTAGYAARSPLIQHYAGDRPAEFRGYIRALTNVAFAASAVCAGWALELNTRSAYIAIIALGAVCHLVGAVMAWSIKSVPPPRAEQQGPRWAALRDRPYVVLSALDGLMSVQYRVLTFAVPLWLVGFTSAPRWSVSSVVLANTVIVVFFQVRASRSITSVATSAAAFRRAGFAFLLASAVFSLLPGMPPWAAVAAVLTAATVHSIGEIWQAAGGFELSYALARPESVGQYQGLFGMGLGLGTAVGPSVLTALCIDLGRPGWWILGAGFALTGLAVPVATRWAERATHRTQPAAELATG